MGGRPRPVDLDRLPVGAGEKAVDGTYGGKRSDPEANFIQMSPDRVAIANGQGTLLFPNQRLTTQTIHVGVPVREVRS